MLSLVLYAGMYAWWLSSGRRFKTRWFANDVHMKDQPKTLRGELMMDEKTCLACSAEIEYQSWPCLVEATWTRT